MHVVTKCQGVSCTTKRLPIDGESLGWMFSFFFFNFQASVLKAWFLMRGTILTVELIIVLL